jgi:tetratricopeptide (TPR) repeat protein
MYRWNTSMYESFSGDFQNGEREARALQELDSSLPLPYSALAFAQLGQGQVEQANGSYQKLATFGKVPASQSKSGQADIALYEGRFADATRLLQQGADEDTTAKYSDRAAAKLAALAYAQLWMGQKKAAIDSAEKALAASKTVRIQFLAGRILAAAGQTSRAQTIAASLASEVQIGSQAYAKLIEGEIVLLKDPRAAIKDFTEANNQLDTWIGHFQLGRAYLEAGAFTQADSEFDQCIKRRGEALALFLDDVPTYGYFPPVYYYLGRVREGLKSNGFAESYKTYIAIRGKAGEDPLLADARKRAGL